MRKSQELLVQLSEARSTLGDLSRPDHPLATTDGSPSPDLDRQIGEATSRILQLESEYRTAVADEAAAAAIEDAHAGGEGAEIRGLLDNVKIGHYVRSALTEEKLSGAEAEFNAARAIPESGIVQLPMELLAQRSVQAPIEERVDAVTAPAVDFGENSAGVQAWLGRLFRPTLAGYLGVTMASPGVGDPEYLILTSSNDPVQRARSQEVDATAATLSSETMTPKRMSARYVWRIEDTARIERLEEQLRSDLEMAVRVGADTAILEGEDSGTGTDADITGLDAATGVKEITKTWRAQIANGPNLFTQTITGLNELIDGIRAQTTGEVSLVLAPTLFRALTSLFASANNNDTIADVLRRQGYTWRVAGNMTTAALAANDIVGLGSLPVGRANAAVYAMWPTMSLIRDVYSGAAKGEVALTSIILHDFKVIRPDTFFRLKTS